MLLSVDDHGPGPVLVLLHGFPLDHSMWHAQRDEVGALYRVISPDLRGFGATPAPEGPYSIDEMADDVIETLDALQLDEPVALGGLSMGGYVAQSIAARHPGRLHALILMSTRAAADSPDGRSDREKMARDVEEAGAWTPALEASFAKLVSAATRRDYPERVASLHKRAIHESPTAIAATLRALGDRPDRAADLAKIAVPTLLIAGADDAIVPVEEMEAMSREIPGSEFRAIDRAGHLAPVERPEAVNEAILRFLGRLG